MASKTEARCGKQVIRQICACNGEPGDMAIWTRFDQDWYVTRVRYSGSMRRSSISSPGPFAIFWLAVIGAFLASAAQTDEPVSEAPKRCRFCLEPLFYKHLPYGSERL
jgi:hypothetical protein